MHGYQEYLESQIYDDYDGYLHENDKLERLCVDEENNVIYYENMDEFAGEECYGS